MNATDFKLQQNLASFVLCSCNGKSDTLYIVGELLRPCTNVTAVFNRHTTISPVSLLSLPPFLSFVVLSPFHVSALSRCLPVLFFVNHYLSILIAQLSSRVFGLLFLDAVTPFLLSVPLIAPSAILTWNAELRVGTRRKR